MWRIILYSIPAINKLEQKLLLLDNKGYDVKLVLFDYLFILSKKTRNHNTTYFAIRYMLRDFDYNLDEIRCEYCNRYKAQPVKTRYSSLKIYRIPGIVDDLDFIQKSMTVRDLYSIHVLKCIILVSIVYLVSFIALCIMSFSSGFVFYIFLAGAIVTVIIAFCKTLQLIALKSKWRNKL